MKYPSYLLRKTLCLVMAGGMIFSGSTYVASPQVQAMEITAIDVFFQGKKLDFDDAVPVQKNGTTLVPFRKLFETLGFTVKYVKSGTKQQVIGSKDGLKIEITIYGTTAKVNGKTVTLSVPAQSINGSTMVPLRFVAENSGYQVSYASKNGASTIRIGEGEAVPGSSSSVGDVDTIEPYVVKGYIRDGEGNPIAGASVYADNTLLYDSNILGVTDKNGFYRLELPQLATTWRMSANFSKNVNGTNTKFTLYADPDEPFASNTGAIRNFTWTNADGYIYLYPDIFSFREDLPTFNMLDVEVTLTPVGGGTPITRRAGYVFDSIGLDQLPTTQKYKITARWLPQGHDPIPLLIRLENTGEYAESTEFEFGSSVYGPDSLKFMREFEVRIPSNS